MGMHGLILSLFGEHLLILAYSETPGTGGYGLHVQASRSIYNNTINTKHKLKHKQ